MTPTISTIEKVRNYQGQNSFVIKMKDTVSKYGGLTPKQLAAVEKCLNAVAVVKTEEMTEDMKRIVEYTGENNFVKDIASKFQKYGTLTEKQKSAALTQIQKEEDKEKTIRMNWPTPGETIVIGRKIGQQLKETYGLEFNPTLIDITRLLGVSPKAVRFAGKMTIKRGKICTSCMRDLTDEFSMLTGMGKICAGHLKIPYIKDASETARFREDYLKRVEEIGEMEFWIPKNQIKKWDGMTEAIMRTM
jgi:DNA-binding FrmR family transcriptional regulator